MRKDEWKKGRSEGGRKEGERRGREGGSSEATQILVFFRSRLHYVYKDHLMILLF